MQQLSQDRFAQQLKWTSITAPLQHFAQGCLITRTDGARLLCFLPPSLRHVCYDSAPRAEPLVPEHTPRSAPPINSTHSI
jgi:hypothetical protein